MLPRFTGYHKPQSSCERKVEETPSAVSRSSPLQFGKAQSPGSCPTWAPACPHCLGVPLQPCEDLGEAAAMKILFLLLPLILLLVQEAAGENVKGKMGEV